MLNDHVKILLSLPLIGLFVTTGGCDLTLIGSGDVDCMAPDENGCSACVDDVMAQVDGPWRLNIKDESRHFRIRYKKFPGNIAPHVQGVARLRDRNGRGRMALTNHEAGPGFRLASYEIPPEGDNGNGELVLGDEVDFQIRDVDAYGHHNHPGGMQAQGDIVAIAMEDDEDEDGVNEDAAVYFLEVTDSIRFLSALHLDGSQGEEEQDERTKAASAGFVRLASNHYLLAVSGSKHGTQGIWFYHSDSTEIDEETTWEYLDFYKPSCEGFGVDGDDCYVGSSGALNLVSDCNGDIYVLAMHGTQGTKREDEYEYLQVFRATRDDLGRVVLEKVKQQQRQNLGRDVKFDYTFRWGGGSYVTEDGVLAVMNTERQTIVGTNDFVDGEIYMRKDP
jgi:hypothetical protein